MTEPWIIFYGHQINMTSEETLNTRWGLFMDLMSCAAIDSGGAEEKKGLVDKIISWYVKKQSAKANK